MAKEKTWFILLALILIDFIFMGLSTTGTFATFNQNNLLWDLLGIMNIILFFVAIL